MVQLPLRFLVRSRSRCGGCFGALLTALLVLCAPALAAQPRLFVPAGPSAPPVEDAEEHSPDALREVRVAPVPAERPLHDTRRVPSLCPVASVRFRTGPPLLHFDPFGNGLGSRLRC